MLLPRIFELLIAQLAKAHRDAPPGRVRHDHLVDEALARGDEGVGEALFIFGGALGNLGGVALSSRKMISTAPLAPMTAISAVGHA